MRSEQLSPLLVLAATYVTRQKIEQLLHDELEIEPDRIQLILNKEKPLGPDAHADIRQVTTRYRRILCNYINLKEADEPDENRTHGEIVSDVILHDMKYERMENVSRFQFFLFLIDEILKREERVTEKERRIIAMEIECLSEDIHLTPLVQFAQQIYTQ